MVPLQLRPGSDEDHGTGRKPAHHWLRSGASRTLQKSILCPFPVAATSTQRYGTLSVLLFLPSLLFVEWNISFHRSIITELSAAAGLMVPTVGHNKSVPTTSGLVSVTQPSHRPRHARVLLGIFSAKDSLKSRDEYRVLLEFWRTHDRRYGHSICSFAEFQRQANGGNGVLCELVYSFVIGASESSDGVEAPTEIASDERPLLVNLSTMTEGWSEFNDTTPLNIRENVNEGKAQTWLRYASQVAKEYEFDYVAKCEAASFLDIPSYFRFSDRRLLPAPYNRGVFAGAMRDKRFWKNSIRGNVPEVWKADKHFFWQHRARFYMESK
jgi:hypothetical protein